MARALSATAITLGMLAGSTPAGAAFHLMTIQEIFVGTPSDMINPELTPDQRAQYIVLRMTTAGQTFTSGAAIRVENSSGTILGQFGHFTAGVANGGSACSYPTCPALLIGTNAAKNLLGVAFDQIVDGQSGRVALPVAGGRACFINGSSVLDCVAWGNFSCTAANCPGGANSAHSGDVSGNGCSTSFGTPALPSGLQFGKTLTRSVFNCATKSNSTQLSLGFPHPVNNAGANINTDTDADGLVDALDCDKNNASIQWAPIEVQSLAISGTPTSTNSWSSESDFVGTGVTYDEIRGHLAQLLNFADQTCFDPDTSVNSSTDTEVPVPGDGLYYLVRAKAGPNCTAGTYGSALPPASRDPLLTICP